MKNDEVSGYVILWKRWYFFWTAVHYGLGVIAIAAPILAGSGLFVEGGFSKILLTVISALAAAFLTFLRSSEKASAFLEAYDLLERALIFSKGDEKGEQNIQQAFERSRKLILLSQGTGSGLKATPDGS